MSLPVPAQVFVIFIWCFYSIIFINTFLCYSSIISLYMKNKYGENIMRTLHHNHGFGQAVRSAVPAVTAFCIFCYKDYVELQKVKTVEEAHVRVCEIAAKAGQPIPQQHPTTVVVHTTHSTNSKF